VVSLRLNVCQSGTERFAESFEECLGLKVRGVGILGAVAFLNVCNLLACVLVGRGSDGLVLKARKSVIRVARDLSSGGREGLMVLDVNVKGRGTASNIRKSLATSGNVCIIRSGTICANSTTDSCLP
jgi:hypothetical protein